MNSFEMLGREKKSAAIADMMRADGVTSSFAFEMSALVEHGNTLQASGATDWWLRFARSAGYKRKTVPSAETRRMVIELLEGK